MLSVLKLYTVIGKGCPVTCQVGSEGLGDQLNTAANSPPGERPGTHRTGGRLGPGAGTPYGGRMYMRSDITRM
jgi:hypothetical protein